MTVVFQDCYPGEHERRRYLKKRVCKVNICADLNGNWVLTFRIKTVFPSEQVPVDGSSLNEL